MARPASEALTEREAQIMDVIWRLGEATAEQVRAALPGAPHDSTVRTLMRVMEAKGYLTHRNEGKAYVYRGAVGRQKAQRLALQNRAHPFLCRVGRGSGAPADRRRASLGTATRRAEKLSQELRTFKTQERRGLVSFVMTATGSGSVLWFATELAVRVTPLLVVSLLVVHLLARRRASLGSAVANGCLFGLLLVPGSALLIPAIELAWLPAPSSNMRPQRPALPAANRTDVDGDGDASFDESGIKRNPRTALTELRSSPALTTSFSDSSRAQRPARVIRAGIAANSSDRLGVIRNNGLRSGRRRVTNSLAGVACGRSSTEKQ